MDAINEGNKNEAIIFWGKKTDIDLQCLSWVIIASSLLLLKSSKPHEIDFKFASLILKGIFLFLFLLVPSIVVSRASVALVFKKSQLIK